MKYRINSYFAILLITIAGAGASLIIIHIVYANTFDVMMVSNQAAYASLN